MSAILNLVLNFIFIKKFGYYAAGYTTLICYIMLSFVHYYFYKKIVMKELNAKNIYNDKFILVISIVLLIIMGLLTITYDKIVIRYVFALLIFVVGFVKRKEIIKIFKTLR